MGSVWSSFLIKVACAAPALLVTLVSSLSADRFARLSGDDQQPGPPANVRVLRDHAAVTNVTVSNITTSAATIGWTTAAPADTQIEFGTTAAMGNLTPLNTAPVISHSVALSGLSSGTLYYFRVRSRDLAGNLWTSLTNTFTTTGTPAAGLASLYPGDVGIEGHPDVVLVERFEDPLANVFGRWTDILNGASMSTTSDVPPGSPGTRSLTIPFGASAGGHLYKQLSPGVNDTLYVRYYIKHPTLGTYVHTGIWMGGNNPASPWPNPQAGSKPAGNDRFIAAAEQNIGSGTGFFDHYNYWMNMRQSLDGNYWGNLLLNDPSVRAQPGQWTCVEHMVKLNNPTTALNGEHAIWLNGVKVSHLGQGFPKGSWNGGIFTQSPAGSPFEGFRWRSDANLNLNWIWLQVYGPGSVASNIEFDHVVVAKSFVGCLASGPSDTVAPTVSISSPAAGTTASGSVNVTANASDNVGVVGVQFKLDGANLGAEDTTAPYSISWNTAATTNGNHTLSAVARDAAGNTKTSAGVAVTVSNTAPSAWPNEPSGFTLLSDFHLGTAVPATNVGDLLGGGWKVWWNTAGRGSLALDNAAPHSPAGVFQVHYPIGFPSGQEPTMLEYVFQSRPTELYWAFWWKASNPFQSDSSGVNKIAFIWTPSGNTDLLYFDLSPNPWRIRAMDDLFAGGGPRAGLRDEPNVNTTVITLGQWYRIEIYAKYSTGSNADGILKWWVNGVLNGHYTNLKMVQDGGFNRLQFAPTYGGNTGDTKKQNDYFWYDHVRVSRR